MNALERLSPTRKRLSREMVGRRPDAAPGGAAVIDKARKGGPAREHAINRLGDLSPPRVARDCRRKTLSV